MRRASASKNIVKMITERKMEMSSQVSSALAEVGGIIRTTMENVDMIKISIGVGSFNEARALLT